MGSLDNLYEEPDTGLQLFTVRQPVIHAYQNNNHLPSSTKNKYGHIDNGQWWVNLREDLHVYRSVKVAHNGWIVISPHHEVVEVLTNEEFQKKYVKW